MYPSLSTLLYCDSLFGYICICVSHVYLLVLPKYVQCLRISLFTSRTHLNLMCYIILRRRRFCHPSRHPMYVHINSKTKTSGVWISYQGRLPCHFTLSSSSTHSSISHVCDVTRDCYVEFIRHTYSGSCNGCFAYATHVCVFM